MAGKHVVCGFHAVQIALEKHARDLEVVWLNESRDDKRAQTILQLAQAAGVTVQRVERAKLDQLAGEARHQGVVAERRARSVRGEPDIEGLLEEHPSPLLLVLDGVQDPHNLGACLRSAAAAGAAAVIVPKDNSAPLSPVAERAAAGAADIVPLLRVTNLSRTLADLKEAGVWIFGASQEAETSLFEADLSGPVALILGGEGRGLRRLTEERCDVLVGIPMPGEMESLNVSVAAGVCLFEAVRQRIGTKRSKTGA